MDLFANIMVMMMKLQGVFLKETDVIQWERVVVGSVPVFFSTEDKREGGMGINKPTQKD